MNTFEKKQIKKNCNKKQFLERIINSKVKFAFRQIQIEFIDGLAQKTFTRKLRVFYL